jgi:hypothetical protein
MSEVIQSPVAHNEALAGQAIVNYAETDRINAEHSSALAAAEASKAAAVAAAEAQKATDLSTRAQAIAEHAAKQEQARDAAKAAHQHKSKSIETRSNSANVATLNDRAEIELYGSNGRTIVDASGIVIADASKKLVGKIEDIRTNPKYGRTPKERAVKATAYEDGLDQLIRTNTKTITKYQKDTNGGAPLKVDKVVTPGEGLELTQAKLVMDLREQDVTDSSKLIGRFIADGMSPAEAEKKADVIYNKKDAARLKLIKEQGVFSREDYDRVLDRTDLYATTPNQAPDNGNGLSDYVVAFGDQLKKAKEAKQAGDMNAYNKALSEMGDLTADVHAKNGSTVTDDFMQQVDDELNKIPDGRIKRVDRAEMNATKEFNASMVNLAAARDEYIRLSINRRSVSIGHKGDTAKAKEAYDMALNKLGATFADQLRKEGKSPEEIDAFSVAGRILECNEFKTLTKDAQESKEANKNIVLRKFNEFYARNTGRKENGKLNWVGMAKKVAAMSALTAVPGVGIAILAGGILGSGAGALTGAYLAKNISRSIFRNKLSSQVGSKTGAAFYAEDLANKHTAQLNTPTGTLESRSVSDLYQEQTDYLNGRNKRRMVGSAAIGAVMGPLAGYGLRHAAEAVHHLYGNFTSSPNVLSAGKVSPQTLPINSGRDPVGIALAAATRQNVAPSSSIDHVGTALASAATANSERTFDVVKGAGIYEQLAKGLKLSPADSVKATAILDKAGYFNGDKILGIGHNKVGQIVSYLNGAGDGRFHIPNAAIEELRRNGIAVS